MGLLAQYMQLLGGCTEMFQLFSCLELNVQI